MEREEILQFADKKCKIIGIKDSRLKTNVVIGMTLIYYFLIICFIVCLFITSFLLIKQQYLYVVFAGALQLLIIVALGREKQVLFLKISYPKENIIKINAYELDYLKSDVKIYLVGIQKRIHKFDYILNILNNDELIYSGPVNYVRQRKILKFMDNLIFNDNK